MKHLRRILSLIICIVFVINCPILVMARNYPTLQQRQEEEPEHNIMIDPTKNYFWDDIETITVDVKYEQTEARRFLDLLNEARIENGRDPVEWDYKLEEGCMLRSAESAIRVAHLRPNGEPNDLAWDDIKGNEGHDFGGLFCEDCGPVDPPSVDTIEGLAADFLRSMLSGPEDDGHRQDMLSKSLKTIGFSLVRIPKISKGVYKYYYYGTMWSGNDHTYHGDIPTEANDNWEKVDIEVVKNDGTYYYNPTQEYTRVDGLSSENLMFVDDYDLSNDIWYGQNSNGSRLYQEAHVYYTYDPNNAELYEDNWHMKPDLSIFLSDTFDLTKLRPAMKHQMGWQAIPFTMPEKYGKIEFSVSDESYATIDENGVLHPLKPCSRKDGVTINSNILGIDVSFPLEIKEPVNVNGAVGIFVNSDKIKLDEWGQEHYIFNYHGAPVEPIPFKVTALRYDNSGHLLDPTLLTCGVDYTIEYFNNNSVGTNATMRLHGINHYTGYKDYHFEIECAHNWDDGVITKEATCTETGVKTTTCSYCGETKKETIPKTSHKFDSLQLIKTPTCTADGYVATHCELCNEYIVTETLSMVPHTVEIDQYIAPTCSSIGITEGSHCSVCGKVIEKQFPIDALPHTYTSKTITKSTLNDNGKIVKTCEVCRHQEVEKIIYHPKTFTLSKTEYIYDGKEKKPSITVKDSKGKVIDKSNYSVSYSKNKNVGTAKATIKFKGNNYSGKKEIPFYIVPKSTNITKVTAKKKGFTVKWNKQSTQTTGYQIQYATNKGFTQNAKTVTVTKNGTVSKTISKLSAKKTYYIHVRTYKTVGGKKYYSSWSKIKSVKTK